MTSYSFLENTLTELEQKGLKRSLKNCDGPQDREVTIDGRRLINFCSNNYLGLANDPRLCAAAIQAVQEEGFGSGASRLVCGNMSSHRALEKKIADFKGTEACLVFNTGYMANLGIIAAMCDSSDIIFADKLDHASIIDGMLLSGAKFRRYPHNDMTTLESWLKDASGFKKKIIITDSVFSMDGDLAPLDQIVRLAKQYEAIVMIDEAHGFGVLGQKGKGVAEHFGVEESIDIQMGTLSKALGGFGAYCCGSQTVISFLINHARSFIYTTGLPPAVTRAAARAVEILEEEPQRRDRLWQNTRYMLQAIKDMGFDTLSSQSPIIPIVVKESALAVDFSRKLFEKGIFLQAIRPPTVPVHTARLRLTVMATHSKEDLDFVLKQLEAIGRELCLI